MLDYDDLEVGGILYSETLGEDENEKAAWELIEVDQETEDLKDKLIWVERYTHSKIGTIHNYGIGTYLEEYINYEGFTYYPPGKWKKPSTAFDEHRERLINA